MHIFVDLQVKFLATYRDKNFMKSHGREDEKFIRKQVNKTGWKPGFGQLCSRHCCAGLACQMID